MPDARDEIPWWSDHGVVHEVLTRVARTRAHLVTVYEHRATSKEEAVVRSGFLAMYRERRLWITSGHGVRHLGKELATQALILRSSYLLDAASSLQSPANKIPVDLRSRRIAGQVVDEHESDLLSGFDAGLLELTPLVQDGLQKNSQVGYFNLDGWRSLINPAGWFLIGAPAESTRQLLNPEDPKELIGLTVGTACLPVQRVEGPPDDSVLGRFPGCFYGKILTLDMLSEGNLSDIEGMSGGPIVSLAETGQIQIEAIQSAWDERYRHIRGMGIEKLLAVIDMSIKSPQGLQQLAAGTEGF